MIDTKTKQRKINVKEEENTSKETRKTTYIVTIFTSSEERTGLWFASDINIFISNFGKQTIPTHENWKYKKYNMRIER